MTTRAKPINDYRELATRFGVVRRAWKRTAALSGMAIVVTESIGLFTAILFIDWLYQPQPVVRIGLWAVALAGIAWFFARHVLAPLLRKIPDEQIALYIEENRTELAGVLITAAEYGRKRDQSIGNQATLIDAVVHEAAIRSAKTKVGGVVSFSRLRKYLIGAGAAIGVYVVLSLLFPETFAHHLGRVLQPWRATNEDVIKHAGAAAMTEPLRFTLSKGDTRLPRGASFDFEVTLSKPKPVNEAVVLNFRPRTAGAEWQKLAMTEIEKLNGFQGTLPDVSEDLEFYVACGADKSDTFHLTVYDPLVIQSMAMTIHYPDYLKQPDRIESPSTGDVTTVIGATATLRIVTSTQLKEGQIKWSNGTTQPVTVDPQVKTSATVSFPVKEDATYDYTITDVNGQQGVNSAPLSVHAVPDAPPTLVVKTPDPTVITNPLGEVNFQVEAGDDFGVEGVDLVYSRLDDQGKSLETRLPLTLKPADDKDMPHPVQGSYLLMLEDAKPPLNPNDAISYHLEARDAKGQKAVSPIGFISIAYYETWGTWAYREQENGEAPGFTLQVLLGLVWDLDNKKSQLQPADLQTQSKGLADKMLNDDGTPHDFLHHIHHNPNLVRVHDAIFQHTQKAHDALVAADTATATAEVTAAVALATGNGLMQTVSLGKTDSSVAIIGETGTASMTMLEKARLDALKNDVAVDQTFTVDEKMQRRADAARPQLQDLLKKQDDIVAKAENQPQGGGGDPSQNPTPTPPVADLAAAQQDIAEKTKAVADQTKQGAAGAAPDSKLAQAADKAAAAAKLMEEAARAFGAGNTGEGHDKAVQAKATLQEANTVLGNTDRDQLESVVSATASEASLLLDKQRDLGAATDALTKEIGGNKPDQRQQRDLQKQAYQQVQLGAEAEALGKKVDDLNDLAQQANQPEAARALNDAQHAIKRGQSQAKMAGAAVDLNNGDPATAGDEQKDAEGTLAKVVASLQAGSDALAGSREAQLNRANRAAQDARASLNKLLGPNAPQPGTQTGTQPDAQAGKQPGTQPNPQAGTQPGTQAGTQPNAQAGTQPGAQAGTQPNPQAGTQPGTQAGTQPNAQAGTQPGAQAGTQPNPQAGTQPGTQVGTQPNAQAGTQPGAQAGTQPGTPPDTQFATQGLGNGGRDEVRKLAYTLTQLTSVIDNRQLVPQDEADRLKEMTMDKAELERRLAVDPKFLKDVSDVVGIISNKIEAEMEAKTEAGKLFSSQREECPPSYRQFVNKYFEALSQVAPKTVPSTPPAQPSQP